MKKEIFNEFDSVKDGINFEVKYAESLAKKMANRSNLSVQNMITEIVDNGKEATNNKGVVNVAIAAPNLPEGCTLMVEDNGVGMSKDDLETLFFTVGAGDEKKPGIHAQMGGRMAISKLCEKEGSYAKIITKKNGYKAIEVIWDGETSPMGSVIENDEDIHEGTIILIFTSEITSKDASLFKAYAALRYFNAINNGFTLKVNGETIKAEDPIYRENEDLEEVSDILYKELTVTGPKDGNDYIVKYHMRDLSMFYITDENRYTNGFIPHSWDVDDNGRCIINDHSRMGVFVKVGDILIVTGGVVSPYLQRTSHAQMNGKRIVLDIPEALAKQLHYQTNKSEGFVDFGRQVCLDELRANLRSDFEYLIQSHVQRAKKAHEEEVDGYKNTIQIPNTKRSVTFAANKEKMRMPEKTFATITTEGDGDHIVLNQNSPLLKASRANKKMFASTVNAVESVYAAFMGALEDALKFQPSYNNGSHPKSVSKESRNQTIDKVRECFMERFMSLGSE